jgi:hypothetical protein
MLPELASSSTPHKHGNLHIKASFSSAFRVDEPFAYVKTTATFIENLGQIDNGRMKVVLRYLPRQCCMDDEQSVEFNSSDVS